MGEVFRAVAIGAEGFEKPVVVKRILPQHETRGALIDMFVDEAHLMSRLQHPNIVQVIDFGRGQAGDYFLVMELVDGVDVARFHEHCREQGELVPLSLALFIVGQALRGLQHAHERAYSDGRALVHRDVSPGNLLLSRVGEVKVADFGVAAVMRGSDEDDRSIVGKPSYMAPEQFTGDTVDARVDVFAIGVVLFQLLTGEWPFEGDDSTARQRHAVQGKIRSACRLRSDLPAAIDEILCKALAADRDARFASAREMARAIDRLRDDRVVIATSDDLAEAVERASASRGAAPIGDLGATSTVQELTRTAPGSDFTLQAPRVLATKHSLVRTTVPDEPSVAAASPSRKIEPSEASRSRAWMWPLAIVVVAVMAWRLGARDASAPNTAVPRVAASSAELPKPANPTATAETSAAPRADHSSIIAPSVAPPRKSVSTPAPPSPSATVPPSTPSADAPACKGVVWLQRKKENWIVRGGPHPAEAPGKYEWPCGTYNIIGVSRLDPQKNATRTILVREGVEATAMFE
jgi:serine/threonine-protein kinase